MMRDFRFLFFQSFFKAEAGEVQGYIRHCMQVPRERSRYWQRKFTAGERGGHEQTTWLLKDSMIRSYLHLQYACKSRTFL